MNLVNYFNNNRLNKTMNTEPSAKVIWCDARSIANEFELSRQYTEIFQNHDLENKWIMMINPDDKSLQQLSSQGKIDPNKILKVNIHQRNISLNTIEDALEKGHCSAVILCNATLEKSQISQLTHYAEKGQTKCIILKNLTQNMFNQPSVKRYLTTSHSVTQLH